LDEGLLRQAFTRLPQHVGRRIDAGNCSLRPALDEKLGRISRTAADIDDLAGVGKGDLREQIARGARALILEFEILLCAPVRHASSDYRVSFLYLTRCGMIESWPSRRILSFS